jgi:hypothetical protein
VDRSSRLPVGIFGPDDGGHSTRNLRDRYTALVRSADRAIASFGTQTARRLVQIFDGGSMPSSPDHFFLAHPVELDGAEVEGGSGSPIVDSSQTIVVDVLGSTPSAGDILSAYMVGGRWVAERSGASSTGALTCSPCSIPRQNLTVSWINILSGNGSTTLAYTAAPPSWTSACSNDLQYTLVCTGGQIEFKVTYWVAGSCPGPGTTQYCSNLRTAPLGLTTYNYSCSPFSLTFRLTSSSCPTITSSGYTQFTITL